jgi:hypothetical protein
MTRPWVRIDVAMKVSGKSKTTARDTLPRRAIPRSRPGNNGHRFAYWPWSDPADETAPTMLEWEPGIVGDSRTANADGNRLDAQAADPLADLSIEVDDLDYPPFPVDDVTKVGAPAIHIQPRPSTSVHTTAISSDWHIPYHDPFAWRAWLRLVADRRPNRIVLLGDILDLSSMSSHGGPSEAPHAEPEIRAGRDALSQVRDVSPDSELWWAEGNHEERLRRQVAANLPTATGLLSLPELLHLDTFGCGWWPFPEKRYFGEVAYKHACGEGIHYMHNALIAEDCSLVIGHTHRPKTERKITGSGRFIWGMGLGCGQAVKQRPGTPRARSAPDGPDWMRGKSAPWVHATGLVYELPDGRTWSQDAVCREGAIVLDGRVYDGREAA